MQAPFDQVLRDGFSRTAAEVEHFGALVESADKAIVPDLVVPVAVSTIAVPRSGVLFIMSNNPFG